MLIVSRKTLQKVEKFKYLGVVFTGNGRWNKQVNRRITEANSVLPEVYRSVVTKRGLSITAKFTVFKSAFVPIFTYGHESWVMTEKVLSQIQKK